MKSYTSKEVIDILLKNGFVYKRSSGSHRIYHNIETNKRVTVPFHNKELPKGTLLAILKQAGLDKKAL